MRSDHGCDLGDVVEFAGCDGDHEVVDLLVGEGEPVAVDPEERDRCREREALVAVGQCVVACEGMQQRCCLLGDVAVCVGSEDRRLRSGQR